ncbi:MAG: TIGR01777 family oxidoreductase [Thermodesulfobacteriota bacterium]|nr:TIGR01777 family oxidoreductase [Thermodesulfobacteriota bacterium]
MKVFITGGTGFVGTFLTKKLVEKDHEVTILTRKIREGVQLPKGSSLFEGNPTEPGPWQERLSEHEVVINLAGAPIFTRWKKKMKKEIYNSRILTTNHIVDALANRKGRDTHLLSTSAVGFYGFHSDEVLTENDQSGTDFLAQVTSSWESAALKAREQNVRVVLCRFGIVLGRHGGALAQLTSIFKNYLGSTLGSGDQWFSWVHEQDLAHIFLFLLENTSIEGPVNCTSPNPVRNSELTKTLGEVMHKAILFPSVPGFVLRLMLGEFAQTLLKGQRVISQKLQDSGYQFQFPALKEALEDLLVASQ